MFWENPRGLGICDVLLEPLPWELGTLGLEGLRENGRSGLVGCLGRLGPHHLLQHGFFLPSTRRHSLAADQAAGHANGVTGSTIHNSRPYLLAESDRVERPRASKARQLTMPPDFS
jgi:hypothetical protein